MASESHIKSLPLKENEINELTAAQESALLFQLPSLLPCSSAIISSPLVLLLLIVNDFFKCEAGSPAFPTLHILATFQDVNRRLSQKLGLRPALCVDVVRMGECARSARACRLPCRPSIFSTALIMCVTERARNTRGLRAMRQLMLKTWKAWLAKKS